MAGHLAKEEPELIVVSVEPSHDSYEAFLGGYAERVAARHPPALSVSESSDEAMMQVDGLARAHHI